MLQLLKYSEFLNRLNEGLIITHDFKSTANILKNYLDSNKIKVLNKNGHPYYFFDPIKLTFDLEVDLKSLDSMNYTLQIQNLINLINNLGYFISKIIVDRQHTYSINKFKIENLLNHSYLAICCEAKYDLKYTPGPEDSLYHVCLTNSVDKILKIGLIPKSKNKVLDHPDRIYLTTNMIYAKYLKNSFELKYNKNYSILEVIPVNEIKFYIDPNGSKTNRKVPSVYTYQNISPAQISQYS